MKIDVAKFPIDPGPAAWNAILEPPGPIAPFVGGKADLLVIGAGFAGLAAARRSRQLAPEARIVVLEARRVAEGPAGRNSGVMVDLPHDLSSDDYGGSLEGDRLQIVQNRAAIAFAAEAAREYGLPEEALRLCGKWNAAAGPKGDRHNHDYARHLEALGEPFERYDRAAMKALTGSDFFESGLYTPGAAILQPAMYVRGLAGGLARAGVEIFENAPVVALSRQAGRWRAETPEGEIEADKAILAVNGHAESFGFYARRLMHIFTYASMTRALSAAELEALGGAAHWAATPSDPMGTTVRRISGAGGDRIVVRNRFTYDPSMEVSEARIRAVARDHDRSFAARFPMLEGVEMAYRWGGRLCVSRNAVPAFGEIEPGLIAAVCQNGLGTTKGTLAGMLAADCALSAPSPLLEHYLNAADPEKLPPEPIAWLGANAVLRWRERRAGREL